MGKGGLGLKPERVGYLPPEDSARKPLTCVIVGGRSSFGNVRKLPDVLWREFGIVVTHHGTGHSSVVANNDTYDLGICLVDHVSHELTDWVKEVCDQVVYAPSGWSHIKMALLKVGIEPFNGRRFLKPRKDSQEDGLEKARALLRKQQEEEVEEVEEDLDLDEFAEEEPETEEEPMPHVEKQVLDRKLEKSIREVILDLVVHMREDGYETLTIHKSGKIEVRRVVVENYDLDLGGAA